MKIKPTGGKNHEPTHENDYIRKVSAIRPLKIKR